MFAFRSRSPAGQKKESVTEAPPEKGDTTPITGNPQPESHPAESHDTTDAAAGSSPNSQPVGTTPDTSAAGDLHSETKKPAENVQRRFSWMPFSKNGNGDSKPSAQIQEKSNKSKARPLLARTRSEKQAQQSALLLRELIIGPSSKGAGKARSRGMSSADVDKVKAQLARPKSAKKVIAQLRQLSSSDEPIVVGTGPNGETLTALPKGPIHAVCLPYTDAEAHERHFCRLTKDVTTTTTAGGVQTIHKTITSVTATTTAHGESKTTEIASVANASITTLKTVFSEINLVSLIKTPDLGLGGPPDGPGILSGALPTAQAIIDGVEQITPQLMALGYATGKAVVPDHAGIYPPTDRMSAITYWWGFEIVLPPPSLRYLQDVPSITHAVINFLTALSLVEGGVREIMPFVRYISSFIDTEFNMIKQEDKGQGVVCVATWIMPAALVPCPWDFPQPPVKTAPPSTTAAEGQKGTTSQDSSAANGSAPTTPVVVVGKDVAESKADTSQNVPKVEITPPTPPASEALKVGTEQSSAPAVAAAA